MYLSFDSELLTSNNLVRDMGREISQNLLHSTDFIVMHFFLLGTYLIKCTKKK